ncbi:MAG TPA: hypothetical protein VF247_01970 [Candidatus Krumholzibacteria bacterium]
MRPQIRKAIACACALLTLLASLTPAHAGAPADDLKQIEYRYYFRGKYAEAIDALQVFLARADVTGAVAQRASEFLAASYVLGGRPDAGKDAFARIIVADPSYVGPDPAVFKPEVVEMYLLARAEYRPLTTQAPAVASSDTTRTDAIPVTAATPTPAPSTPIYKKWWFYAGAAALAGIAVAAAGGSGDGGGTSAPSGTVVVGVTVR